MENTGASTLDLVVLGLLLLSGLMALFRGLVREVFSLVTWLGAAALALFLTPSVTPWFHEKLGEGPVAIGAAGLSVFCGALLVFIPLSNILAGMIKGNTLTAIDRSLGFVFGIVRGVLFVSIIYLCFTEIVREEEAQEIKWLAEAKTKPFFQAGADSLRAFIPQEKLNKLADEAKKQKELARQAAEDAKRLQELATPQPAVAKDRSAASYAPEQGEKINQLGTTQGTP